jgi:hypothetical protein
MAEAGVKHIENVGTLIAVKQISPHDIRDIDAMAS